MIEAELSHPQEQMEAARAEFAALWPDIRPTLTHRTKLGDISAMMIDAELAAWRAFIRGKGLG